MTIPSITPLPTAPDPGSPATFDALATPFMSALPTLGTELNAAIAATNLATAQVTADVASADADAATATTKAAEALASANTAVNSASTAGTATDSRSIQTSLPTSVSWTTQSGKNWGVGQNVKIPATSAPANWMLGYITAYNNATGAITVMVTHSQGSGTYTAWNIQLAAPIMSTVVNSVQAKSSGFTAYKYDKGRIFHCSAALTMALDAVATLDVDWYSYVVNTGTSTAVTVDPNGSETVNGVTTLTIQPGETYLLYTDASALYAIKISGPRPYLKVSDQKASGANGGSSTGSDITQTRTLNTTEVNTISGASLASDTITLPAGTYSYRIRAPFATNLAKAFLYNTSDSTYVGEGSNNGASTAGVGSDSIITGRFTITSSKNFKIRYYHASSVATSGLGYAVGSGRVEVYTEAEFWKEA